MKLRKQLLVIFLTCVACMPVIAQDLDTRAILDPFTGTWRGTFSVYSHDGRLLDQLETEHRYWWDGSVQRGTFIDTYPDGRVVRAEAQNYAEDGVLYCVVEKDNGERTVHRGHFEDGSLFWYRQEDDVTESFRERIIETPLGRAYHIDGFGAYGAGTETTHFVYKGRYREVSE